MVNFMILTAYRPHSVATDPDLPRLVDARDTECDDRSDKQDQAHDQKASGATGWRHQEFFQPPWCPRFGFRRFLFVLVWRFIRVASHSVTINVMFGLGPFEMFVIVLLVGMFLLSQVGQGK